MVKHVKKRDQSSQCNHAKQNRVWLFLDYYQHAFALFHGELDRASYTPKTPHSIRERYWHLLPYHEYEPYEGREFLLQYLDSVESELASLIGKHSIAYWLHLYRRLSPGAIGADTQPATIGGTRATLEAAIQKYGLIRPCGRIGFTDKIRIEEVFNGLLLHPDFEQERKALKSQPQLVLTDFGTTELKEFYDVERLAYEAWRSSALLRVLSKGAPLVVTGDETAVSDARSSEIARLTTSFDQRSAGQNALTASATGVVFAEDAFGKHRSGVLFLPIYNLGGLTSVDFKDLFAKLLWCLTSSGCRLTCAIFGWLISLSRRLLERSMG
jgi:hypothetical protein